MYEMDEHFGRWVLGSRLPPNEWLPRMFPRDSAVTEGCTLGNRPSRGRLVGVYICVSPLLGRFFSLFTHALFSGGIIGHEVGGFDVLSPSHH